MRFLQLLLVVGYWILDIFTLAHFSELFDAPCVEREGREFHSFECFVREFIESGGSGGSVEFAPAFLLNHAV